MKESWKYEILGNVCDVLDSKRKPITKNKRVSGTVPYYGATGVLDFVKDFIFDEKLVLLGEDGAKWGAGELSSYIINGKSWVNNHAHTLRPKRYIISDEFLVYYLNYSNLLDYVSGTTVPKLNQANMRRIEIPLPTLSDQQKIVDLLDAEFEKIDAIKANAASQLQSAKDLFQSALKEIFEIKGNWKYSNFSETYPIAMGRTPARADNSLWDKKKETHNLWVSIADISNNEGREITDTEEYVSDKASSKMRLIAKGSLLMSFKLTIGKMAFAGDDLFTNEAIIAIPDNGKYNLRFLYYYLSNYNWSTLTDGAEKVKGKTLNKTSIGKILLPILSLPEQERIAASLDAISEKVKALQANYDNTITLCNDLKQSLLKSIFA